MDMQNPDVQKLVDEAWKMRKEAFSLESEEESRNVAARVRANLEAAINLFRDQGSRSDVILTLGKLSHVGRDAGNFDDALAASSEAVSLARKENNPSLLAHAVRHLGEIQLELGETELAAEHFSEAVSLYRDAKEPHPLDVANALIRLAGISEDRAQTEACELWEEARQLYLDLGIQEGVRECDDHLKRCN